MRCKVSVLDTCLFCSASELLPRHIRSGCLAHLHVDATEKAVQLCQADVLPPGHGIHRGLGHTSCMRARFVHWPCKRAVSHLASGQSQASLISHGQGSSVAAGIRSLSTCERMTFRARARVRRLMLTCAALHQSCPLRIGGSDQGRWSSQQQVVPRRWSDRDVGRSSIC